MQPANLETNLASEIAAGDRLPLIVVSRRFAMSPSSCFRWVQRGLPGRDGKRIKLQAIKVGKKYVTSEAALERFFSAIPQTEPTAPAPSIRTLSQRERDSARAAKALREEFGI